MDVITLFQNNFKTSVAPLGTALTSYQLDRAWKVCQSPIIMFDGDEAGQKAAERVASLALNGLSPDHSLRFCLLPKDYDPDDYLKMNTHQACKMLLIILYHYLNLFGIQNLKKKIFPYPKKSWF